MLSDLGAEGPVWVGPSRGSESGAAPDEVRLEPWGSLRGEESSCKEVGRGDLGEQRGKEGREAGRACSPLPGSTVPSLSWAPGHPARADVSQVPPQPAVTT